MRSPSESILHDAASLYRFVDSISATCELPGEYPSYLESSQHFFQYLRALGDRTKAYLEGFSASLSPQNQIAFNAERQKLATLRFTWFELHEYARTAIAAHSLNVPSPLLMSLLRRFRSVQGLQDKDFVILHTDVVNYFEAHAMVRSRAEDLRNIIPNAPVFPHRFGVIQFPYSQAESVFLNCLIAHEMGHFLFDELTDQVYNELLKTIGDSLKAAFRGQYSTTSGDDLRWCRDVLRDWAEEIFCDLFALWMVGPCFSLAYIELLDLAIGLYPSTIPSNAYLMTPIFTRSHPARLFRLKEHASLLKRLGWWTSVVEFDTHLIELLKLAEKAPEAQFSFVVRDVSKSHLAAPTLEAFFLLTPHIGTVVDNLMAGVDSGLSGYLRFHNLIEDYLSNGVVPSTVVVGNSAMARMRSAAGLGPPPTPSNPDFVAIINTAYKFYLENLATLVDKIEQASSKSCADRNVWLKRLEAWTMKAIEDSELFRAMKES